MALRRVSRLATVLISAAVVTCASSVAALADNPADLGSFTTAFVTNSHGIAPVGQIDDLILPVDDTVISMLTEAYESADWDPI